MINSEIIIDPNTSMIDSLAIMDRVDRKLLIVCDGGKFIGVISIGDIQRAILKKQDLSLPVSTSIRAKITYAMLGDDIHTIKKKMHEQKIECMPIVDNNGVLCDVIEWDQLFDDSKEIVKVNCPVVIMAGGKGTRLLPLTNVIPKPLIPVSDKTIIEEIMSNFQKAGADHFYISLNYMMEIIKDFFSKRDCWNVDFIHETKPLGTAGALFFLKNKIDTTFFLTNCDTLVDLDLNDLLQYHKRNNNIVTVVSAIKTIHIPYGTLETGVDGVIKNMREKPDYIYQINSGFYVMEPEIFDYLQNEEFINVPDLINKLINDDKKVGAFPVSEKSWVDMGNWDEYLTIVNKYLSDK
ncbi:sugar phosphate nucleotidyltransferase [Butyrivibrio sp. MC2013]|uniref:sugar phosphate nucleotidyltransferase n=1 Tax=Butyrivibrio sp. MC2013 TaxID=1280686 RepID=UPI000478975E|nr:sugar phosphate nucleotidyltransferase [Butyrivibrio sp. MC2013]